MNAHLRHDQLVDALSSVPDGPVRAHLDACEACRAELAGLQAMLREVREVDLPEPSPLFWDHFSHRVRQATAGEAIPAGLSWWHAWWRPAGMIAAAAGALALALVLRPASPGLTPAGVTTSSVGALADDGSWGLVIGLASELDASDVREAAKPAEGTADAMIEELTATQRAALARLLQEDMGGRR